MEQNGETIVSEEEDLEGYVLQELAEVERVSEYGDEDAVDGSVEGVIGDDGGRPLLDMISSCSHLWVLRFCLMRSREVSL